MPSPPDPTGDPVRIPRPCAVTVAATLATAMLSPLAAGPARADHREAVVTDYGFAANAFGSRAKAEPLATGSARTAPSYLGCTRVAGRHSGNYLAQTGGASGSALRVTGVDTTTRSYRGHAHLGTRATSSIATAVLGEPDGATITIEGLRTRSHVFARRSDGRLRAETSYTSTGIEGNTGTPLDAVLNQGDADLGDLVDQIRATPGDTLPIPGFGELSLGRERTKVDGDSARAVATALRGKLYGDDSLAGGGDDSNIILGTARANLFTDVRSGIMRGRAIPLEGSLTGDLVQVGRVNDRPLPCRGTDGEVRSAEIVGTDLGDLGGVGDLVTGTLAARVYGFQRENRSAVAWTRSRVSSLFLTNGENSMTIRDAQGRANVVTDSRGRIAKRNIRGSGVGAVVVNGQQQEPPGPGDVIEVPGLARLEFFLVDRADRGLKVTAVRVSLLSGTEVDSVLALGRAQTYIGRS